MTEGTYVIGFSDGDVREFNATRIEESPSGELRVFRGGGEPYVIPRGEWESYGGPKVVASAPRQRKTKRTRVPPGREWVLEADEVQKGARFSFTDDGNASRFCEDHDGKLIYVSGPGWHRWTGKRWMPIPREAVLKEARATARKIRAEGLNVEDNDTALATVKWVKQSSSAAKLDNMIKLAQGGDDLNHADLAIEVEQLDHNVDVINTLSGIVDLRTGKLIENRREEYCTRITQSAYDRAADQSEWLRFIERIVPDKTLRATLKRCLGATITGHVPKALFLLLGSSGDNGKTQLIEAISGVLGNYAGTAMESTFTNMTAHEAGYMLAELRGVRFVSFAETREGHGLATERVKRLTGGDKVSARRPYGKPFEYEAQFSLWMGTNHPPLIPAREKAMWKRVWAFPFNVEIPRKEQIPNYGDRLARKHGPAILAWLVEGAMEFYADGSRLGQQPSAMETQRATWQERDDIIRRWLEDRTERTPRGRARMVELWKDFQAWCVLNGEQAALQTYTSQKFHAEMDEDYPRGGKVEGSFTRDGLVLKSWDSGE